MPGKSQKPKRPTVVAPIPITGTIWHFSDLHFDPHSYPGAPYYGVDHNNLGDFAVHAWEPLLALITEEGPADFLVFSGDFVDAPKLKPRPSRKPVKREPPLPAGATAVPATEITETQAELRRQVFRYSADFILALAEAHGFKGLLRERVIVCPGNHDVDWERALTDHKLSLVEFSDAFKEFLRPDSDLPYITDEDRGVTLLTLNTAYLGGTLIRDDRTGDVMPADIPAFSPTHIDAILTKINRNRATKEKIVADGTLGIVVAHHPPAVIPTPDVDVRPFEIAIGAGQAKRQLRNQCFRLFLHGHKHVGIVHQEVLYSTTEGRVEEMLLIGAPSFIRENAGFNIIRYAFCTVSGEARILVRPYSFGNRIPKREDERRVVVPPLTRTSARLIRIVADISVHGDSKVDFFYHQVSLPTTGRSGGGWQLADRTWQRDFIRVEQVPLALGGKARWKSLTSEVTCRAREIPIGNHAAPKPVLTTKRAVAVTIAVPIVNNGDPRPRHHSVSFVGRTYANGSYAVSKGHVRRTTGEPQVPQGIPPGREALTFVLRDPAERLELTVNLPFPLPDDHEVEVHTYTETQTGGLRPADDLRAFSECVVEPHLVAKQICVSIIDPLPGIAYVVSWQLPEETPELNEMPPGDWDQYQTALDWAEELRKALIDQRKRPAHPLRVQLQSTMENLVQELLMAGVTTERDKLEWSIFVPDTPLCTVDGESEPSGKARVPQLVPVAANYDSSDSRWISWPAGTGVVGRAYAVNQHVVYRSRSDTRPKDEWNRPDVPFYEPRDGRNNLRHAVLYGLPLPAPRREKNDIIWGVLCIGTSNRQTQLDLDRPVPLSDIAPGPRNLSAAVALISGMGVFSSWFVNEQPGGA